MFVTIQDYKYIVVWYVYMYINVCRLCMYVCVNACMNIYFCVFIGLFSALSDLIQAIKEIYAQYIGELNFKTIFACEVCQGNILV